MIKQKIIKVLGAAALAITVLAVVGILMLAMGRLWFIGRSQLIITTTTTGTSIQETQKYLGPPRYEENKSKWEAGEHADAVILPEGTTRIVVYKVLYGDHCYVFLNSDGFILGTFWFFT